MCAKSQRPYDGFHHLVRSINANSDTLMPMFTLYCDDSGTHSKSEVAIAACYISTVEQWERFRDDWDRAEKCEGFGVFHMADFVTKQQQFAKPQWGDTLKRDRTIKRLINIIKTRVRFAISCAVIRSAYDEVITGDLREIYGHNHYTFAVRHCTGQVDTWRAKHGHNQPIQYIFDRLSKGKGEIDRQMEQMASGGDAALKKYGVFRGGWSFQDKAIVTQLQAADIWAWENYKHSADTFFPEKGKPVRRSYRELRQIPHAVRYHGRSQLIELMRRINEEDQPKKR